MLQSTFIEIVDSFVRSAMVGVAASITVGPVAVLCIQRTLTKSRNSGLVSGLGVACADTLMAVVAYFFYAMLQGQIELYNVLLRVVGGIFVVGVGVYVFLQNPVPQIKRNRRGESSTGWQDFISIFGLTLTNFIMVIPYLLAFFAVFKVSDGEPISGLWGAAKGGAVMLGFFLGSISWWSMIAFAFNLFRKKFRPRHLLTLNHIAGILIGGLGAFTILSTIIQEYISINGNVI